MDRVCSHMDRNGSGDHRRVHMVRRRWSGIYNGMDIFIICDVCNSDI